MTNLYLKYRNNVGEPYTLPPSLVSVVPTVAAGALPVAKAVIETAPVVETPCGCPGASTVDDHLILRAELIPLPINSAQAVITYLMNYKISSDHQAEFAGYAQSIFVAADITLIRSNDANGLATIRFRLAATMTNALITG